MSASSQLVSESYSGINIPNASVFTENIYASQRQLIESAFAELSARNDGSCKVVVELDQVLNSTLRDEILSKGYLVQQYYSSDSSRQSHNQTKEFTVVIEPPNNSVYRNRRGFHNMLWKYHY